MSRIVGVSAKNGEYSIIIDNNLQPLIDFIKAKAYEKAVIITDKNVNKLYSLNLGEIPTHKIVLPAGEATKSNEYLLKIYDELLAQKITRADVIIAFGGGVIGDLSGYAAATYLRGIDFIQLPTTIVAQVDSSSGGKVAINLPQGKNLVGAFYQPKFVMINPDYLNTLSPRIYADGMAEVIKHACIFDSTLFNSLEDGDYDMSDVIFRNCEIKRHFVEQDPFDTGERMKLNFGHTIGHAIEQYYNYSKYTHGEAVAIGMYAITRASEKHGLTKPGTADRIKNVLIKHNLPYELDVSTSDITDAMIIDKKVNKSIISLIILEEIGVSKIHKIDKHKLEDFL